MKDERLFVRLTSEMRQRVREIAARRGEAESVIVREALNQYFETRDRLGESSAGSTAFGSRRTETDSRNEAASVPRSAFRAPRSRHPRKP